MVKLRTKGRGRREERFHVGAIAWQGVAGRSKGRAKVSLRTQGIEKGSGDGKSEQGY